MKKQKNIKDLAQEVEQIDARLKELKTETSKLGSEVEYLEDSVAEEKGKITTSNINIKNFTVRKLKARRERNKMVREEQTLEETRKTKKKQLDKSKKEFFENVQGKKDYTTEKYGPEYLQDLGAILMENGNNHEKKKEVKKDENT
jgi:chromosome segregation ATPase